MNATAIGTAARTPRSGGEALVQGLLDHGIDTVFALPGAQIYALCDALAQRAAHIRTIGARHEQAIGYMAYGYARASGRVGVGAVVPGPGLLNASAALLTANTCCTPLIALTSDVTTTFRDRHRYQLHELREQLAVARAVCKWAQRVDRITDAPALLALAFQAALSGRQGVAALQVPWDLLEQRAVSAPAAPLPPLCTPAPDTDALARAAGLIAVARAPMILTGSGALQASTAITALAEQLGAPVVSFRGGRGVVSDEHPLGCTVASGARLWPSTDLALVIGSRFELLDLRWRHRPAGLRMIRIDIDPLESERLACDLNIVGDAGTCATALLAELGRRQYFAPDGLARISEAKAAAALAIRAVQPQVDYLAVIREVLPRDGIFVDELSQVGFASIFAFPVYQPRTLISAGAQGTLGFGLPTALGAKVACPGRPVVSVCGDGGFMFAASELATAVQYRINVVVIVFNNNAYGNVLRDQQRLYAGRLLGAELVNPDFVRFAQSFGVDAQRVDTPAALRPALARALALEAPALIEVSVARGAESDPWPFLHPPFADQTPF
jgi:acetolactate synthase I/II/III large subunit